MSNTGSGRFPGPFRNVPAGLFLAHHRRNYAAGTDPGRNRPSEEPWHNRIQQLTWTMWSSRRRVCALSTCNEAVYKDPLTRQEHDFCGRTHATLFKQQQQQLQHQKAATPRPDRYMLVTPAVLRSGAVRNQHKSNPRPSGPHTSAGYNHGHPTAAAANGVLHVVALPPAAQQTLPMTHYTPKVPQALRVTDTMVLFWNPPCVFTQWEPALFEVDGVSSDAEYRQI